MNTYGIVSSAPVWLLEIAFLGAGFVNAFGPASIQEGFVRWGYPRWWNYVTGSLEVVAGVMIATDSLRVAGLILALTICVAAGATLLRFREFSHLPPAIALGALAVAGLALSLA